MGKITFEYLLCVRVLYTAYFKQYLNNLMVDKKEYHFYKKKTNTRVPKQLTQF